MVHTVRRGCVQQDPIPLRGMLSGRSGTRRSEGSPLTIGIQAASFARLHSCLPRVRSFPAPSASTPPVWRRNLALRLSPKPQHLSHPPNRCRAKIPLSPQCSWLPSALSIGRNPPTSLDRSPQRIPVRFLNCLECQATMRFRARRRILARGRTSHGVGRSWSCPPSP